MAIDRRLNASLLAPDVDEALANDGCATFETDRVREVYALPRAVLAAAMCVSIAVVESAVAADSAAAALVAEATATKVTTAERRAAVEDTEHPVKYAELAVS